MGDQIRHNFEQKELKFEKLWGLLSNLGGDITVLWNSGVSEFVELGEFCMFRHTQRSGLSGI